MWSAIYDQSALREAAAAVAAARADGHATAAVPHEQVVLYRLISGMHTAITTSIVHNFYDETTGGGSYQGGAGAVCRVAGGSF